jgi:preprotein translocase subunit SecF
VALALARRPNAEHLMLRILHDTKIDFIGRWRIATAILIAFLIPGIIWILISGFGFGIEFTGGTLVQLEFRNAPDVGAVRTAVSQAVGDVEVQTFGSPREIVVRAQEEQHVRSQGQAGTSIASQIERSLQQRFGASSFRVVRTEAIGARVGDELARNATIAMLISFAVSLIYLAIRFEWRFGLAAVLANMHDIVATFAFIKYMQIEITLFVVGGILTVIGYSLSDTVVVFDRVRELLRQGQRVPMRDTLNRAVNETLPRTVMTGTTVIACLLALVIFGGGVLRPFALVLLFGIIVGTLSSIYVASPLLLFIERRWPRHGGESKGTIRALAADRQRQARTKDTAGAR